MHMMLFILCWTCALDLCSSCFWYYIDYIALFGSVNLLVWRLVDMVVYLYGSVSLFKLCVLLRKCSYFRGDSAQISPNISHSSRLFLFDDEGGEKLAIGKMRNWFWQNSIGMHEFTGINFVFKILRLTVEYFF